MPATRATASTSPFVIAPDAILEEVSGSMYTRHRADARRWLGSLAETSTIRARPRGSRWVNSEATGGKCRCGRAGSRPGPVGRHAGARNLTDSDMLQPLGLRRARHQPPIWLIDRP